MPRARNIKPSLFKNEILGEADPLITILFTGLWCLADREGRMEDRPKRIKVEVFPYRDGINVDEMLGWLEDNSFIHRYQIDDESYIQIRKFHTHQRPHHMESESLIPPMPGDKNKLSAKPLYKKQKERILERDGGRCVKCGATEKLHIDHVIPVSKGGTSDDDNLQVLCATCNCSKGARIENESRTNRERIDETASCSTDSLNLIPDSGFLIPDSSNADKDSCASGDALPDDKPETEKPKDDLYTEEFEEFWRPYPNKKAKKEAAKKFKAVRKKNSSREFLDRLIEDVSLRSKSHDWTKDRGQFVPMASTYLNQERWTDPEPIEPTNLTTISGGRMSVEERNAEVLRRLMERKGEVYDQ